jgi:hypothetical protein
MSHSRSGKTLAKQALKQNVHDGKQLQYCPKAFGVGRLLACAGHPFMPIHVREAPSQRFLAALRRFEQLYSYFELSRASFRPGAR